jgi:hypothetical protein
LANRPADDYEARYMADEGAVLYRDKIRMPWYLHGSILAAGAAGILGTVLGGEPLVGVGLIAPVTALMWTNFITLRVTVTSKALHVQYGLFGPRIPIEDIVSVKAGKYNWLKYGGKGIRFGLDGSTAYNMFGDKSEGVEVTYKKGRGTRTVLVSAADPQGLANAIMEAQAKAGVRADSALQAARADLGVKDAPEAELDAVDPEVEALLRGEVPEDLEVPAEAQKRTQEG